MRFWLRWAIVTLPVVVCLILWIASFWYQAALWGRVLETHRSIGISRGSMGLILSWRNKPAYEQRRFILQDKQQRWSEPIHHFLGFGYESDSRITWLQAPMWFVALLAAIPPLMVYRRHRRSLKKGFPIQPMSANSKESAPVQTA